ncbi:MAG: hypothetical protein H6Q33_923 [Deltaproteobacteria bacterium]|nr:hypothetical protein [Deltaproteobacteria bacterium]
MQTGLIPRLGITGLALALTAPAVHAGQAAHREARQRARIHQGVTSGQLTRGETTVLQREQRHIEIMREHALADGDLGPKERARLDQAQNYAGRDIYRLKHNERAVPPSP